MNRAIAGFHVDAVGDWVADLTCGHGQHVRHRPPFTLRPWVVTEVGRASRLGVELACPRCDAFEIPAHFVPSRRTPDFDASSLPAGLRAEHSTARGVWGRIVVEEGALRYVIPSLDRVEELSPGRVGVVVPELRHHVEPLGGVRFHVEFLRAPPPEE